MIRFWRHLHPSNICCGKIETKAHISKSIACSDLKLTHPIDLVEVFLLKSGDFPYEAKQRHNHQKSNHAAWLKTNTCVMVGRPLSMPCQSFRSQREVASQHRREEVYPFKYRDETYTAHAWRGADQHVQVSTFYLQPFFFSTIFWNVSPHPNTPPRVGLSLAAGSYTWFGRYERLSPNEIQISSVCKYKLNNVVAPRYVPLWYSGQDTRPINGI